MFRPNIKHCKLLSKPTKITSKWYILENLLINDGVVVINSFLQFSKAINGQGIDRHLLGLKQLAIENGIDIPTLYLDPGYSVSNNWRLSTSQVI